MISVLLAGEECLEMIRSLRTRRTQRLEHSLFLPLEPYDCVLRGRGRERGQRVTDDEVPG